MSRGGSIGPVWDHAGIWRAPTVELALRIHLNTKRFVVVTGASDFDKGFLSQPEDQFRSYENRVWSIQPTWFCGF